MTRPFYARALGVATLVLVAAACGATSSSSPSAASTLPPATPVPAPSTAVASPSTGAATTFDTTSLGADFDLPLAITLPADWKALPPPDFGPAGTFTFVHTGDPASDDSQWWGPDMDLVAGASVADPADMGKPVAAGDAKLPWPASYLDYLASLPGVTVVEAPRPVTVGGVVGRQIVVKTPPMHPTIFLKGDTMWLGGGAAGFDRAGVRDVIELTVDGTPLLISYGEDPALFDQRRPLVDAIVQSIQFNPAG